MKKLLCLLGLFAAPLGLAQTTAINQLPAGTVSGPFTTICDTGTATFICTYNQIATWLAANITGIPVTSIGGGTGALLTPQASNSFPCNVSGGSAPATSACTLGTGLSFSGTTLNASGSGSGTVSTVSVAAANGFSGSVVNPTTTPAITLQTSITGPLKGSGNALAAAGASDISALFTTNPLALYSGTPTSTHCASWSSAGILQDAGAACGTATGTVTTTGTPTTGSLAGMTGATSVGSVDLSGDVTTSGTLAVTVGKINGGTYPTSAAIVASNSLARPIALTLGNSLNITNNVLSPSQNINNVSGTTYTVSTTDLAKLVVFNSSSAVTVTLPVASTTGFGSGYFFDVQSIGAGLTTITPTSGLVGGMGSLVLYQGTGCRISTNGGNYEVSMCTAIMTATGYTIANLPTCASAIQGMRTYVTNGVASPTYYATVSTTGSSTVPVFCTGSTWVYN